MKRKGKNKGKNLVLKLWKDQQKSERSNNQMTGLQEREVATNEKARPTRIVHAILN